MEVLPLRTDGEMDAVIQKYQGMVYGLAFAKTGSRADADDVFQETFLAYLQAGKRFRDEEHRKAWLLRTALNMSRRVTASTWRRSRPAWPWTKSTCPPSGTSWRSSCPASS